MTVFENETEVEPMYICECVPAVDVWNTNKQVPFSIYIAHINYSYI